MIIRNKIESADIIKKLNLNQFPEKVFKHGEVDEVLNFLQKYPAEYYALRDKSKSGGKTNHKVKHEDVLNGINVYDNLFSINVSSYNYIDNQKLVGEILIKSNNMIEFLASMNSSFNLRDAYANPDFNFNTNIFDDKTLNEVPFFNEIFNYIYNHNLIDVIVEFAYFDKPLGINNENIIIYEIRTDY